MIGTQILDHYENSADRSLLIDQVLTEGLVHEFEVPMIRKNGSKIWVSLTETIEKEQENPIFIDGLIEDITKRKQAEYALNASQQQLWTVIEGAPVSIFATDLQGKITLSEGRGFKSMGLSLSNLVGKPIKDVYFEYPDIIQHIEEAMKGVASSHLVFFKKFAFETWFTPMRDEDGVLIGMTGVQTDITPRIEAERALRDREYLLQAIVDAEPECVCLLDHEGEIREINPAGLIMLEVADRSLAIGTYFDTYLLPQYRLSFRELTKMVFAGHSEILEIEIMGRKGSIQWLEFHGIPLNNQKNNIIGLLGIARNITDRKRAEEQLIHDALHDGLTGLPNRTLLLERLRRAILLSQRRSSFQFAVIFLDVDRFKVIVDSLGHIKSDHLLRAIARRLESCVSPGDTVARLGGDEFTLLLEDLSMVTEATLIADKIQSEMKIPFKIEEQEIFCSVSIGIAFSSTEYTSSEDVLRDADTAMFRAKAQGRAQYQLFDSQMHAQAVNRLQLETDLRRAVERNEFVLHYQPVVDTKTGQVKSFEALVRWMHPKRGLVGPSAFIPIAEETGMIVDIGKWVLIHACKQLYLWKEKYNANHIGMAVNVAARQFAQNDLIDFVEHVLKETQISPEALTLEITETSLVKEAEKAREMLIALRKKGVRINIDDFGTGYCSLSYLHRFPVDGLKIDGSFVRGLKNTQNAAIVRSVLMLAKALEMNVIAEGAETVEQMTDLREMGCFRCQGYYFSKPLPAAQAGKLIERSFPVPPFSYSS